MPDDLIPPSTPQQRRRRVWITIGELVGVLALVIAGLNAWQSHQQFTASQRAEQSKAHARAAFVMTGVADAAGDRIDVRPLNPDQAIQRQVYIFPHALADRPIELAAARPRLERTWIEKGLRTALKLDRAPASGEGVAPVAVVTTYVQDGDAYTDGGSLYEVGYTWRSTLFGGRKITLEGVALAKRGVNGALADLVNRQWEAAHPVKTRATASSPNSITPPDAGDRAKADPRR